MSLCEGLRIGLHVFCTIVHAMLIVMSELSLHVLAALSIESCSTVRLFNCDESHVRITHIENLHKHAHTP